MYIIIAHVLQNKTAAIVSVTTRMALHIAILFRNSNASDRCQCPVNTPGAHLN
jgi:hypothetical protein